jgi:hypothetical protein
VGYELRHKSLNCGSGVKRRKRAREIFRRFS